MGVDTQVKVTTKEITPKFLQIIPTFIDYLKENDFKNKTNIMGIDHLDTQVTARFDQFGTHFFFPVRIADEPRSVFVSQSIVDEDCDCTDNEKCYYVYFSLGYSDCAVDFFKGLARYLQDNLDDSLKVLVCENSCRDEFAELD